MALKTEIKPDDVADLAVGGLVSRAAGIAGSVPFLGLDEKLKASPVVKGLERQARDTIIQAGNDKSSWFGQIFQWFAGLFTTFMNGLNNVLGIPPEQPSTPATAANAPAGQQTAAEKAAAEEKARLAAEKAKPPTKVEGGVNVSASQSQTTPDGKPAPAAGVKK